MFKLDPDFLENEEKYKTIKRGERVLHFKVQPSSQFPLKHFDQSAVTFPSEILDEGSSDSGEEGDGSDEDEDEENENEEEGEGKMDN